jgi:hypothetical protein
MRALELLRNCAAPWMSSRWRDLIADTGLALRTMYQTLAWFQTRLVAAYNSERGHEHDEDCEETIHASFTNPPRTNIDR